MTRIFINGRFLTQPMTGVQRYALEVVRQWDRWLADGTLDSERWSLEILTPRSPFTIDPALSTIPLRSEGSVNGQVWEQMDLPGLSAEGILFCPCNSAPLRSLYGGQSVVVTVHDLSTKYFPEAYSGAFRLWYDVLMPAVFRYAARVVTVAQCEKKSMLERYPKASRKLRVVQNGSIEPSEALVLGQGPPPIEDLTDPYILYVGSMSRRKNVQGVLAATEILLQEFPNLQLVLVGGSTQVFAEGNWQVSGELNRRLHLRGQVNNPAEIFWLYRHARCFVFPSFFEASPLPPIEAMATGCPVVASAIPSHHERLGDAALYCDPHDAADIARRVAHVLRDPGLATGLAARGIKRAGEYSWKRCAEETLRVIDEIASKTPRPTTRRRKAA